MIYPKALTPFATLGIPAPSNGIFEKDRATLPVALAHLQQAGFQTTVTKNAFCTQHLVSAPAKERAQELENFWQDAHTDALLSLTGGEFMIEILPHLNFDLFSNQPKWFQGFSDNTTLTFTLPTLCDIATIYGYNAKSFGIKTLHQSHQDHLSLLLGKQYDFTGYTQHEPYYTELPNTNEELTLTQPTRWDILAPNEAENINISGRMLGGCLDILVNLVGTPYDHVSQFIQKYEKEGIFWFLETCDLSPAETQRALWLLRQNGWFKNAKGFLFGRPLEPADYKGVRHTQAIMDSLQDLSVPIVFGGDIGHVKPAFPVVCGSVGTLQINNHQAHMHYDLIP